VCPRVALCRNPSQAWGDAGADVGNNGVLPKEPMTLVSVVRAMRVQVGMMSRCVEVICI
jgi:hypothetical protein